MKNKRIIVLGVASIILAFFSLLIIVLDKNQEYSNVVPDDYICVFHGGAGELTYSTYIYKKDNGHANHRFEYINTKNTTVYWGSSDWNVEVIGRGEFDWIDEAFNIARKNNAYSYVKVPGDSKTYSIEEFERKFIMN